MKPITSYVLAKRGGSSSADSKEVALLRQKLNFLTKQKGRMLLLFSTHAMTDTTWYDLLRVLDEEGIPSIFMSEAWDFMQGKLDLPPLAVVLRGDDASNTWYTNGFPWIKERKHKFTMYFSLWHQLVNAPAGSLTNAQIQEMVQSGLCEIQFHAGIGGHDPNMPINGSGGVGYFFSNRKWLSDQSRVETDAEFQARVEADMDSWLTWYDTYIRPLNGGTTLHFAPPNGEMGTDGAGNTRYLLIQSLKKKNFLTASWRNHMQWVGKGEFVTTDAGLSYGQTNANYDFPGLGCISDSPNAIRQKLRIASMSYMPDTYFSSRFDYPVGSNYDWYVQAANGGDTFTLDGVPYLKNQNNSLKFTFGASTQSGTSFWKRTLPNNMDNVFFQVAFGIPTGLVIPNNATVQIADFGSNTIGLKLQLTTDGAGVITAKALCPGGTTISLGTVTVPASGVNWYTAELHMLQHSLSGVFEAWWNNNFVSGQRGLNTVFSCNNIIQIGKDTTTGLTGASGSILFGRVVLDSHYIGRRDLLI